MSNKPNVQRIADVIAEIMSDKYGVEVRMVVTPKEKPHGTESGKESA